MIKRFKLGLLAGMLAVAAWGALIAILSLVFFPQVATWLPNLGNAVAGG
ncbi:MAG: hypothetical protein QM527_04435 [Alphaproteobacteria bacterium]|nr:hypothetical protein [Alphaproteobacteria bacterium]